MPCEGDFNVSGRLTPAGSTPIDPKSAVPRLARSDQRPTEVIQSCPGGTLWLFRRSLKIGNCLSDLRREWISRGMPLSHWLIVPVIQPTKDQEDRMTVSPNRPQDGNLQSAAGGSGVGPNDRSRPVETPPTLFKLPNLGAKRTQGQLGHQGYTDAAGQPPPAVASEPDLAPLEMEPQDSSSAADARPGEPINSGPGPFEPVNRGTLGQSAVAQPNFDHFNRPVSPPEGSAGPIQGSVGSSFMAEAASNGAGSWSAPTATESSLPPSSTVDDGKSRTPTSEASKREVPAGRTWMDALGSHGVVIVLLLLVVAAALLTGNGEEDPAATSMSTQSELLSFDDLSVDLPLPTHGGSINLAESEPAVADEVDPVSSSDLTENLVGTPTIADSPEPAATARSVSDAPMSSSPVPNAQPVTNGPAVDPVASLEAPVATSTSRPNEPVDPVDTNNIQFNRFVASQGMVDAMTASRRVETTQTDSSLPSLEELAGLQGASPSSPETNPKSPVRVLSKTPVGIPDWSKYLPPLDSALKPDAGLPSSSNQVVQP